VDKLPNTLASKRISTFDKAIEPRQMRTLIIDNYDSFTFNLQHYLEAELNDHVAVMRNDKISLHEVEAYDQIVLSPGPGLPEEAGITMEVIRKFADRKRILGVCLGHQAIGLAFGGRLENLTTVQHGVTSSLCLTKDDYLWSEIPDASQVGRYHSWVVERNQLPDCLEVIATDEAGEIMAIRHTAFDIRGVQFHPESIMTTHGRKMIRNWIKGILSN
jgi:anthranilate synthase component 2